jgi:hypothetical protein
MLTRSRNVNVEAEAPERRASSEPERVDHPDRPTTHQREPSVTLSDDAPNLATAIQLMTDVLRNRDPPSKKTKAKEPDTFDGSDSRKLNNFVLLCSLYFRSNPAYDDDSAKVIFALSYLRGTALEYFEPQLLDANDTPLWLDDWEEFVSTLRTQFGPIDPTGDAESGIDHLKMHDNQRIIKYNVEFNKLAVRTHWDEGVLRHRYYSGLAERIKDIMGQQGKPDTLEGMKKLAHAIDSRHWERLSEKSRSNKGKPDHDKSDKNKSDDRNKNQPSGSGSSNNNPKNKSNKSGKPATTSTSSGSTNPLADKLGKDGKLTKEERQRRFDNNLCMFCGGVGHTAANCNKASSSAAKAKARAAQAKDKESPAGDSKKV